MRKKYLRRLNGYDRFYFVMYYHSFGNSYVNKGFSSHLVIKNPATGNCGVFILSCFITGLGHPVQNVRYEYK